MVMRKLMVFSAVTFSCFSTLVTAQSDWQHCDLLNEADFLPYIESPEESEVDVKADNAQLIEDGTSVFTGNVEVNRAGQQMTANRATYDQVSGNVSAQGDVIVRDSDIILNADQGEWSLTDDKGSMIDAEYRLRESHARGEASHVHRQGKTLTKLKNATYTTCAPGDNAWLLQSSKVDLDHVEAVGSAENVVVRLGGMPIFYTPYISFPLNDERKSGFLTPAIGNSDETGFDVSTPYYWNIAPNKDATLTPRYMSDRGLMLRGEFRYLYEKGEGIVDAGFMGSDDLKNDGDDVNPNYDDDRKHFSWQNKSQLSSKWKTNLDYNYVSDDQYLEDFGSSLSLTSTTHLNRNFNANYNDENWEFVGRLQGFQTLTDASKPYQKLPQLKLKGSFPDQVMGLTFGLSSEYVDFDHDKKVAGERVNLAPSVSLPWRSAAAFITPRVELNHTRYDLDDNVPSNIDDTPTRTLPITSVDSGLFFERDLTFGSSSYLQTLEPRAFYLYVPHRDQDEIPDFDTSLKTFNMGQLFSYNRFSGTDRIGDANQLSLALTSRLIDQETGREKLRLTFGQIRYFDDRDVSLGKTYNNSRSSSDLIGEVVASISKEWSFRSEIQWDHHESNTNMAATTLRYRNDNGRLLNMAYRYRRDDVSSQKGLEQVDISARLPLNKQWSVVGRWYRSLKDDTTYESLGGIEYESCCWATRLVVRDYVNDVSDDDRNLAVFFQLELKGLGNFGQKTETLLERSILGYDI
jgi:LPS-assembly protein